MGAQKSKQRKSPSGISNIRAMSHRDHRNSSGGLGLGERKSKGSGKTGDQQAAKFTETRNHESHLKESRARNSVALNGGSYPSAFIKTDSVESAANLYWEARDQMVRHESSLAFDHQCKERATDLERRVDSIIRRLREIDVEKLYNKARPMRGHSGQIHPWFEGDHFLTNAGLIDQTEVLKIISWMPKGAHLHIHFNSCLAAHVLLDIAKGMDRMFITSDLPLLTDDNGHPHPENFSRCEIQFSILSKEKEGERPGNLFSVDYRYRQTMHFRDFLEQFSRRCRGLDADQWLLSKLVFSAEEAHGPMQSSAGAWEKFNGRTRMMKGLFNYEKAYRQYTAELLRDFVREGIQYAEIRPNFMMSNQLFTDDGTKTINNEGIMKIIIDEVTKFMRDPQVRASGKFHGLKVIYCTPRVFKPADVHAALEECLRFKKMWPTWIAGFDLVGEEAKGNPLREFVPQLLEFQKNCQKEGVEIPFLFHCGETLDLGTDTDGNLVDALLLGSRRIGHGFALPKHPYIMQKIKEQNVCVEICPISNEILGLTPRANGHAMYQLLANNVHCSVSSDNGTIFGSTLSHDFYQVMVGKADMGLFGWKQLILWSLEHACLDDGERFEIVSAWEVLWGEFLRRVSHEYGHVLGEPHRI